MFVDGFEAWRYNAEELVCMDIHGRASRLKTHETQITHAIGRVVICFNRLEHALSDVVSHGLGDGSIEVRDIINALLSYKQKLDVINALMSVRLNGEQLVDARKVLERLAEYGARRNVLVHSFYGIDALSSDALMMFKGRLKRKCGFKKSATSADAEELKSFATELDEITSMLGPDSVYMAFRGIERAK